MLSTLLQCCIVIVMQIKLTVVVVVVGYVFSLMFFPFFRSSGYNKYLPRWNLIVWVKGVQRRTVDSIPANSPGFPGSLQVFHQISRSHG